MNKRGFSTKKGGGKSPSGKGVGNSSFNDDWRSGKRCSYVFAIVV